MSKKFLNIVFWIAILVMLFIAAQNFYNRYQSKAEVENKLKQQSGSSISGNDPKRVAAPDFLLKDLEGKEVRLSDYKGKIVVLNFWASWCPPCREEIPDFIRAHEEQSKGNDAVVLAVNLTNGYNNETPDRAKKFVRDNKMTMKVLLDEKSEAAEKYGIVSIPTTFFIDREGFVHSYSVGTINYNKIMSTIKKIMEE